MSPAPVLVTTAAALGVRRFANLMFTQKALAVLDWALECDEDE